MIIAIDGPAGSGKGTLAKRLAGHFGLPHLDTGLLYRAVALTVLDSGLSLTDAPAAARVATSLDPSPLDDPRLKGREMGDAASVVSAYQPVRDALLDLQRRFAAQPGGAVLDGRDIGTAIFPDATVKLFVTASVEERARRRWLELKARGVAADLAQVEAEIRDRDAQDANRPVAPLRPAPDAVVLDTTALDAEAAFAAALAVVRGRLLSGAAGADTP
jgi:CMP/dCMP kinase